MSMSYRFSFGILKLFGNMILNLIISTYLCIFQFLFLFNLIYLDMRENNAMAYIYFLKNEIHMYTYVSCH